MLDESKNFAEENIYSSYESIERAKDKQTMLEILFALVIVIFLGLLFIAGIN